MSRLKADARCSGFEVEIVREECDEQRNQDVDLSIVIKLII